MAVVGTVAAVLVVLGLIITSGGGDGDDRAGTDSPTRQSTIPRTEVAFVHEPRQLRVDPSADGWSVSWQPPSGLTADDEVTYLVFRSDPGHDSEELGSGAMTSLDIASADMEPDDDGEACLTVQARLRGAEASREVCFDTPEQTLQPESAPAESEAGP